jgi:hypothetical protein
MFPTLKVNDGSLLGRLAEKSGQMHYCTDRIVQTEFCTDRKYRIRVFINEKASSLQVCI